MVFISPLWARTLNGCARLHVGKVLVLNLECTRAMPVVKYGCVRSGKYSLSWTDFIYYYPAGKGDDVEVLVIHPFFYFLPDAVQFPLEIFSGSMAGDENLPDVRLAFPGVFAQNPGIYGDSAEMHQRESLPFDFLYYDSEYFRLFLCILREEDESCAVFSFFRDGDSLKQNEFVRNLEHDACTVAGLVIGSFGTAVFHVFQNLQRRVHKFVRLVSMDVHNHSDTARIVFVSGVVKIPYSSRVHKNKLSLFQYKVSLCSFFQVNVAAKTATTKKRHFTFKAKCRQCFNFLI